MGVYISLVYLLLSVTQKTKTKTKETLYNYLIYLKNYRSIHLIISRDYIFMADDADH